MPTFFDDVVRVETDAIVTDGYDRIVLVAFDTNVDFGCLGMLADIGQGFLHDMQHLKLFVRLKWCPFPRRQKTDRNFCLQLKTVDGSPDRRIEIVTRSRLSPEVQKQFADIFVTFLHAVANLIQRLLCLVLAAVIHGALQEFDLDIQKGERLRNRIVEFLSQQIAFFSNRVFPFS